MPCKPNLVLARWYPLELSSQFLYRQFSPILCVLLLWKEKVKTYSQSSSREHKVIFPSGPGYLIILCRFLWVYTEFFRPTNSFRLGHITPVTVSLLLYIIDASLAVCFQVGICQWMFYKCTGIRVPSRKATD